MRLAWLDLAKGIGISLVVIYHTIEGVLTSKLNPTYFEVKLAEYLSLWIIPMFFIVSVLYSSVGFGGGSSYLAILALTGMAFTQIRATALLCNIAVVSGNIFLYHNQKKLDWKKILPLVIISIPLSFLGGYLKISEKIFFVLLGVTLLFAAITMWISKKKNGLKNKYQTPKQYKKH